MTNYQKKRVLCHCTVCKGVKAQQVTTVRDHLERYKAFKPARTIRHDAAFKNLRSRPFGRAPSPSPIRILQERTNFAEPIASAASAATPLSETRAFEAQTSAGA